MIRKILIAMVLLLFTEIAAASFTVEWGYTPPSSPSVASYKLYKSGVLVAEFLGASTTSGVVGIHIANGDTFTLTAYFKDGTESPHSSPFTYNGAKLSVPVIVSVLLN